MQEKQAVMYVDASVDEKAGKMAGAFLMLWQQKGGGSDQGGWVSHGGFDSMLGEALAVCQGLAHATTVLGPGAKVTIFSDNQSLVDLINGKARTERPDLLRVLGQIAGYLKEITAKVKYRKRCSTPEMRYVDARAKYLLRNRHGDPRSLRAA